MAAVTDLASFCAAVNFDAEDLLHTKKAYTAAAHFGTNRIGRNSAEKREGPKPGSKNSAWGWSPYFFGFVWRLSIVSTLRTGKLTIFE